MRPRTAVTVVVNLLPPDAPHATTPRGTTAELPRLRSIARQAVPNVLECTVIPTVIFSVGLHVAGFVVASIAALVWAYAVLVRRLAARRRIPGLLMLTTLGL